jgi:hypothetical protein
MEGAIIIPLILILILWVLKNQKKNDARADNLASKHDYSSTEILLEKIRSERRANYTSKDEFEVVGVHVQNRKNYIIDTCLEGSEVELVHEKGNRYSKRAVAVRHYDKRIGYIAEEDLDEIHMIISKDFDAYLSTVDFDGAYLKVKITIEY